MIVDLNTDNYEDEILIKEHGVEDGDIVEVNKDRYNRTGMTDLYTVDYIDEDGDELALFKRQCLFPIKSNRLAKKLYPNAPEKEGMLWIEDYE